MIPFLETFLEHLGRYQVDVLRIEDPGIYRHGDTDHLKQHILPKEDRDLDLLPLIRDTAPKLKDAMEQSGIKWHRYAHHLNSSQMLAVNLFQPLLQPGEEGRRILAEITETAFPSQRPTGFEFVPSKKEGTNIDFCVTGADGIPVFMELKLTESEFGGAEEDEELRWIRPSGRKLKLCC